MADFKLRHAKYYMNDIHANSEKFELDARQCRRYTGFMSALAATLRYPNSGLATALVVAASLCFGIVPLFARWLLAAGLSPEAIAIYRFGLTLLVALPFFPRQSHKLRSALWLIGAGYLMGLGWTTYVRAIEIVPLASAGVIYMSYPLFVVVFARFLLRQAMTWRALLAAALVVLAAATALAPGAIDGEQAMALLLCLPAPLSFALVIIVIVSLSLRLTAIERICCTSLGAVAALLPGVLAQDPASVLPPDVETWFLVAVMALATATLPQIVYVMASPQIGPARAAVAGAVELPTMMMVGWLVFGESLGLPEALAAGLILAAILLAPAARRGQAVVSAPKS
jgi:drug/metabolite transporter (DMT)-like permease